MNIDIIGGDVRQLQLKKALTDAGFSVKTYALETASGIYENTGEIVLLPVPFSKDGRYVFAPLTNSRLETSAVLPKLCAAETVIGGKVEKYGFCDILLREDYALKNARLTAEGAVTAAVGITKRAFINSRVLIVGYGRIGKILAEILKGYSALVTVSARRKSDFSLAASRGIDSIETSKIADTVGYYDIIFNTVEAPVLTEDVLKNVSRGAFIFELASNNAGIDTDYCLKNGVNFFSLPGLPAKYFPQNAAAVYTDTVFEILKEKNYL